MIKIVSVENMREIEKAADAAGMTYDRMMQNAGRATALRVLHYIQGHTGAQVTVLVGPGNNGGDGLVAGRVIAEESDALVRFYLLRRRDPEDPNLKAVRDAGLLVADAEDDQRYRVLHHMIASSHVIVDGLFGIGLSLPLRDNVVKLLRQVHAAMTEGDPEPEAAPLIEPASPEPVPPRSRPYVVAIDCPSGLQTDTGELDDHALYADETVTFIAAKPGLLTFPGAEAVGRLFVSTIGVPEDLPELKRENWVLADGEMIRGLLPT
ncbi:MAG: NAD(P)H-hydrate epimerase, partial [Anaerolineae bacterium]|nr:NAD(P)H-hydrate epimerase [Anaerolineae bacterium]